MVGVRLVDHADGIGLCLLDGQQGFGFALGLANALLLHGLGTQDGGLLFALGAGDGSLLFALGQQDGGALLAVRLHLFLHGLADLHRRLDVFQLDAVDLDAPAVRGLVKAGGDLRVDEVAARQGLVQRHRADDVTQRRGGQVLDGLDRAVHAVGVHLGVKHLKENDGVDHHRDVVAGDDGLRREVGGLLLQRDLAGDALDKRRTDVQARAPGILVDAEPLGDIGVGLRHNNDAAHQNHQNNDEQDGKD